MLLQNRVKYDRRNSVVDLKKYDVCFINKLLMKVVDKLACQSTDLLLETKIYDEVYIQNENSGSASS